MGDGREREPCLSTHPCWLMRRSADWAWRGKTRVRRATGYMSMPPSVVAVTRRASWRRWALKVVCWPSTVIRRPSPRQLCALPMNRVCASCMPPSANCNRCCKRIIRSVRCAASCSISVSRQRRSISTSAASAFRVMVRSICAWTPRGASARRSGWPQSVTMSCAT